MLAVIFLALAVVIVLASAAGILLMPGAARKLHFLTPAAIVAPVLVAAAVLAAGGLDYGTGMAWLTVVLMVGVGPFLSHATIRAIRSREGDASEGEPSAGPQARPDAHPTRGARR